MSVQHVNALKLDRVRSSLTFSVQRGLSVLTIWQSYCCQYILYIYSIYIYRIYIYRIYIYRIYWQQYILYIYILYIYIYYIYSIYIYPITIINSPFRNFSGIKMPSGNNHGNWKSPYRLLFRLDNHRLQMVDVRLPCLITRGHPPYSIRNILDLVQSWAICLYSAGSHVRMITL